MSIVRPTVLLYAFHAVYYTVYRAAYPAYKNKKLISNSLAIKGWSTGREGNEEKGMKRTSVVMIVRGSVSGSDAYKGGDQ